MPLTIDQIRESLERPKKKEIIREAVNNQNRIRFHVEPNLEEYDCGYAFTEFIDYVESATDMPQDKMSTFKYLMRFPVKTTKEADKIFDALGKVFDGQNPVVKYDFTSSALLEDWLDYITKKQIDNKWRTDGLKAMRTNFNSFIVVDLPSEQEGKRPDPYFYFLDICHAIDFQEKEHELDWIIFRQDEQTIIVIDEVSYQTYFFETEISKLKFISANPHGLGYCPVRFFWSEYLNEKNKEIRLSPIGNHLGDFDWLLYFMTAKQHLDTYAGYPIYSGYEIDCDYDEETADGYITCHHGWLKDPSGHYMRHGSTLAACPACSRRRARGPATYYEVPRPGPDNDNADMRNPIQITSIDRKSLEYNVTEVVRLKREIHQDITGYFQDQTNEQAKNVPQIMSYYESRTAKLRDLKKNFELAMEFTEYTMAKLRYGSDFISCYRNLGTDFYLYESQYLLDLYTTAKASKADDSILDSLIDQYYISKYRNSPDELNREMIIKHIDPCRHIDRDKAVELWMSGVMNDEDLVLKLNFATFVLRFERENAPLTMFGEFLPFNTRIEKIKQILYSYGKGTNLKKAAPGESGK